MTKILNLLLKFTKRENYILNLGYWIYWFLSLILHWQQFGHFFFLCSPIHCRSVESDLPLTHSKGMNNRCFEFSHRKWNTIATTLSLLQICFKHYILYCRQRPTPENITKLMLTYDQGTIQWRVSLKNWWGCLMWLKILIIPHVQTEFIFS